MSKRRRIPPTDDWQQLSLLVDFPEQLTYEVLRPVVLFGYSPGGIVTVTSSEEGRRG